ncbi:MAG TPA: deoxyribose-phosphate aldolase [Candidatus Pacearchaeota archaeon]|nr:deoxyribose-phosphate aldolase [Candidatus Pacearchaeota archaeon]HOK94242.1 deoxyribose-phosphate aldolase [Candidatus Pacearchaeota archaeon]HPO75356.1 deoxyribose-phosphate aldolase [Candidatus Pacearchaeota archaeon]
MSISKYIDHTNIRKNATEEDIKKSCEECKKYHFRGLCVNPEWTKLAKEILDGTGTKVTTLIDPPMGLSSHEERMEMAQKAKEDGSDELDVVMNVVDLKYEKDEKVLEDLKEIAKILPTKVIIGSGYLTDGEIARAARLVKESGAICVKTATEKDPLDRFEMQEKAKHIKIMKENAQGILVKAAGGISNLRDMIWMIENGADIIGTSSSVEIMEEIEKILL